MPPQAWGSKRLTEKAWSDFNGWTNYPHSREFKIRYGLGKMAGKQLRLLWNARLFFYYTSRITSKGVDIEIKRCCKGGCLWRIIKPQVVDSIYKNRKTEGRRKNRRRNSVLVLCRPGNKRRQLGMKSWRERLPVWRRRESNGNGNCRNEFLGDEQVTIFIRQGWIIDQADSFSLTRSERERVADEASSYIVTILLTLHPSGRSTHQMTTEVYIYCDHLWGKPQLWFSDLWNWS